MRKVNKNVSIIIPAKNEGTNIFNTIKSILAAKTFISYEIIIVDDGSEDNVLRRLDKYIPTGLITIISGNNLGVARARQLGARSAGGEILLFCDAHVFVEDLWLDKLVQPLNKKN